LQGQRITLCANCEIWICNDRLSVWQIILRRRILSQPSVPYVSYHPDNFAHGMFEYIVARVHPDVFAYGALAGEVLVRKCAIDDDGWRSFEAIVLAEGAAGDERDSK
jgi:hypothetical protein